MRWSLRLGRLFGIDIYVHATFAVLLTWVALVYYLREGTLHGALVGVGFMSAVFGIVVLHELGHALMARRFGVRTRDITLLPIGGVARLERMPERPLQELLIALAGPAVNVGLALALSLFLSVTGGPVLLEGSASPVDAPFLTLLLWVNVILALFNLLPAFPMDGGRALRALLALGGDYVQATRTAAALGQSMALVLGLLGLLTNPFLVFVALFVWIGAAEEARAVETKAALDGLPVQAAMLKEVKTLSPADSLEVATEALLAGSQVDFPVLDGQGALLGILTRADLIRGLSTLGPHAPAESVMTRRLETADPGDMLVEALARLQGSGCGCLPVLRQGRLVGLVTLENIGELLMVKGALQANRASRGRATDLGTSPGELVGRPT